jgi:dTDP-4-amino-4,6-dideoxy-D-galactose acyltransferase
MSEFQNKVIFKELNWDTNFFGVKSARVEFEQELSISQWENFKNEIEAYEFVSILNYNSNPLNAQLIGKETTAFLADVNIQFEKELEYVVYEYKRVDTQPSLTLNEQTQIKKMTEFKYSKFIEDPFLKKRNGSKVYKSWLSSAFIDSSKFFLLSRDEKNSINGYVLYSFKDDYCVIELISVGVDVRKSGVGTYLIKSLEDVVRNKKCNKIRVGTQVRNFEAINFYQRLGYKQIECNQVYHLWNTKS